MKLAAGPREKQHGGVKGKKEEKCVIKLKEDKHFLLLPIAMPHKRLVHP